MLRNTLILLNILTLLSGCYVSKNSKETETQNESKQKLQIQCDNVSFENIPKLNDCAEKGDANSQMILGVNYIKGIGVEVDVRKAAYFTELSAQQGNTNAQFNLAIMYAKGQGVSQDPSKAYKWMKSAADAGHADAINSLGKYYQQGFGISQNSQQGFQLYLKAAELGNGPAQVNLSKSYYYGRGVAVDKQKAIEWAQKSIENNMIEGMTQLGFYLTSANNSEGVLWTKKAAELGESEAQANLAAMYFKGLGVNKDIEKGKQLLNYAIEKNSPHGWFILGTLYAEGEIFPRNNTKAYEYYLKAAKMGDASAQNNLGVWLLDGRNVARNEQEAVKWLNSAAENGIPEAMTTLVSIYGNGTKDTPKDEAKKQYWQNKLSAQ